MPSSDTAGFERPASSDLLIRRMLNLANVLQHRRWAKFMVAALALAVGVGVAMSQAGNGLEHGLREVRDLVRSRPASGEIVIVEIDAHSIHVRDQWPWPRTEYASAVDALTAAKARSIAFDIDLSSQSVGDDMLVEALARAKGSVILPTFRQAAGSGIATDIETLPLPAFQQNATLASVNVHPDQDGVMRVYPLGTMTNGVPRPSIAALLAETNGSIGRSFPIDFAIDPKTIPRVSFDDLVSGRVSEGRIAGKRVIIGATAIELGDRYAVPGYGILPGVVVQALAAETLIEGRVPNNNGPLAPILAGLAVAAAILARRRTIGTLTALSVASLAGLALAPLAFEATTGDTIEVAPAIALLVVVAIFAISGQLLAAFAEAQFVDSETGLPNARAMSFGESDTGSVQVAAIRVSNGGEIATLAGVEGITAIFRKLAERTAFVFPGTTLYRYDTTTLVAIFKDADSDNFETCSDGFARLAQAAVEVGGRRIDPTLNIGLATDSGAASAVIKACIAADNATAQGVRWLSHDNTMDEEIDLRMAILADLDFALAERQIHVVYQPKWDVKAGAFCAAEALVRWHHPERGNIPPDMFIPVIEAEGRTADLTGFVLGQALADMKHWHRRGFMLDIAVNLSASLLGDKGLASRLARIVQHAKVEPSFVTFEVTESATLANPADAIRMLETLRDLGFKISIDDYGTGQSTLSYLKQLPAQEIKIDKSFVLGLGNSRSDLILVRSTIELAHELGIRVVAEGVEDAQAANALIEMGCDILQGWHYGRPMPADDLLALTNAELEQAA